MSERKLKRLFFFENIARMDCLETKFLVGSET